MNIVHPIQFAQDGSRRLNPVRTTAKLYVARHGGMTFVINIAAAGTRPQYGFFHVGKEQYYGKGHYTQNTGLKFMEDQYKVARAEIGPHEEA